MLPILWTMRPCGTTWVSMSGAKPTNNGIESFWAMLKRGYYGTYHRISPKHLGRYVKEFSGRHNQRFSDTLVQMRLIAVGMCGKRLRYKDLIL